MQKETSLHDKNVPFIPILCFSLNQLSFLVHELSLSTHDRLISLRTHPKEPLPEVLTDCQLDLFCPYILPKASRPGGLDLTAKAMLITLVLFFSTFICSFGL